MKNSHINTCNKATNKPGINGAKYSALLDNPNAAEPGVADALHIFMALAKMTASKVDKNLEICGHSNVKRVTGSDATCMESGYTVWQCQRCIDTYVEDIPEKPHSFVNKVCMALKSCGEVDWRNATKPNDGFYSYMYRRDAHARTIPRGSDYDSGHYAIDITTGVKNGILGYSIYAQGLGTVEQKGTDPYDDRGYYVTIRYSNGYYVRYLHLQFESTLVVGKKVGRSTLIGYTGNTGESTEAHLHYDINASQYPSKLYLSNKDPKKLFPPGIFN